jgi:hypothetical protein
MVASLMQNEQDYILVTRQQINRTFRCKNLKLDELIEKQQEEITRLAMEVDYEHQRRLNFIEPLAVDDPIEKLRNKPIVFDRHIWPTLPDQVGVKIYIKA